MSARTRPCRSGRSRWHSLIIAACVLGTGAIASGPALASTEPPAERFRTIRMVVGPAYVDADGNTWRTETGFRGGTTATFDADILGTRKDPLYQRERYGADGYDIPVSKPGTYRTTLNLAELWFTTPGLRVFDVRAEGRTEASSIDIFARTGALNTAFQLSFDSVVTDGSLTLDFVDRVNVAKISSIRVELVTPVPDVYSKVASIDENPGESWADACLRTMTYGYTGCVRYFAPEVTLEWDHTLVELAEKAGNRRVDIQLTAKAHTHSGLADVLSQVPAAWKPTFIYNIWQEPEAEFTTPAEQAEYRADYSDAATVTREYGFQLPWLELQEWGVNPDNPSGWNIGGFFPPARDYQGVLWSLFEFHQRDLLDEQVGNITAAMRTYAPGKPWGLMASEYALPAGHITESMDRAQGAWLTHAADLTRARGSQSFGWFNMLFDNGDGLWEGRVEVNPYALSALRATAD